MCTKRCATYTEGRIRRGDGTVHYFIVTPIDERFLQDAQWDNNLRVGVRSPKWRWPETNLTEQGVVVCVGIEWRRLPNVGHEAGVRTFQ